MDIELRILKANHGDSILISGNFDGVNRNILIDGGPAKTFEYQHVPGNLKKNLIKIKAKKQKIDLLILTHVDDDHIAGLLSGFKKNGFLSVLTNEVWFNSGKTIFDYFEKTHDDSNLVMLKSASGPLTSIRQGITLEEHLNKLEIWEHPLIIAGDEFEKFGIKFKILSPSIEKSKKLLIKWEREYPDALTSSGKNDYNEMFSSILDGDEFKEDTSIHNGSSIAFIFEYKEKSILFLGDAHPSTIIKSLRNLGYSVNSPLQIDYMKISHHGSKANTNEELLKFVKCDNFIISTDGSKHNLPNKRTLARIIKYFPAANLIFNYPHLIKKIFKPEELDNIGFTVKNSEEVIIL